MLRLTYLLRRRPGMSLQEFKDYLSDIHGQLIVGHSTTLKIQKYLQTYTIDDPLNEEFRKSRNALVAYDGMQELWFESRQDFLDAIGTSEGQAANRALIESERSFVDLEHSCGWFCYEVPQINPLPENIVATERSPLVKVVYILALKKGQSSLEAQFYWRVFHGPKVRQVGRAIRTLRYMQVHRLEDNDLEGMFFRPRNTEKSLYYGHAELWFDRVELVASFGIPEGMSAVGALMEDESGFIDFPRSAIWLNKERVILDKCAG